MGRPVSVRRVTWLCLLGLMAALLAGCVHYVPRDGATESPTELVETPTAEPASGEPETDANGFPNPAQSNETKRY